MTLITKLYLNLIAPLLLAVLGSLMPEGNSIQSGTIIVVVGVLCGLIVRSFLRNLFLISEQRRQEAKLKYVNKTYSELKDLYLANPHEAALFIAVKPQRKLNSPSLA